jgi:hypothetical protein
MMTLSYFPSKKHAKVASRRVPIESLQIRNNARCVGPLEHLGDQLSFGGGVEQGELDDSVDEGGDLVVITGLPAYK